MDIQRQHDETTIEELVGESIDCFWGAGPGRDEGFTAFYLQAGGEWHRFFIDHDTLFWATLAPNPEDDLIDDEVYVDIVAEYLPTTSSVIERISFINGVLSIVCKSDQAVVIRGDQETHTMHVSKSLRRSG